MIESGRSADLACRRVRRPVHAGPIAKSLSERRLTLCLLSCQTSQRLIAVLLDEPWLLNVVTR